MRIHVERLAQNAFHQVAHLGSVVLLLLAQAARAVFVVQRRHGLVATGGQRFAQAAKNVDGGALLRGAQALARQPLVQRQHHAAQQALLLPAQRLQRAVVERAVGIGQRLDFRDLPLELVNTRQQPVKALLRGGQSRGALVAQAQGGARGGRGTIREQISLGGFHGVVGNRLKN